jgi:hypothetical protein
MSMAFSISMDESDVRAFTAFVDGMGRRASREALLPILQKHLEPVVEAEKEILSSHIVSGALSQSLSARIDGGRPDRAGSMTAFSIPSAKKDLLSTTWGVSPRSQHRKWFSRLSTKRRTRIFYGAIVHQGHRIVVRRGDKLIDTGKKTTAVPFAELAAESKGEQQIQSASIEILERILGK